MSSPTPSILESPIQTTVTGPSAVAPSSLPRSAVNASDESRERAEEIAAIQVTIDAGKAKLAAECKFDMSDCKVALTSIKAAVTKWKAELRQNLTLIDQCSTAIVVSKSQEAWHAACVMIAPLKGTVESIMFMYDNFVSPALKEFTRRDGDEEHAEFDLHLMSEWTKVNGGALSIRFEGGLKADFIRIIGAIEAAKAKGVLSYEEEAKRVILEEKAAAKLIEDATKAAAKAAKAAKPASPTKTAAAAKSAAHTPSSSSSTSTPMIIDSTSQQRDAMHNATNGTSDPSVPTSANISSIIKANNKILTTELTTALKSLIQEGIQEARNEFKAALTHRNELHRAEIEMINRVNASLLVDVKSILTSALAVHFKPVVTTNKPAASASSSSSSSSTPSSTPSAPNSKRSRPSEE